MKTKLFIMIAASAGIALASPQAPTAAAGSIPDWLDTDGDGVISELERQAFVEARRNAAESLASQWDTNGDGVIDEEERAAAVEELKGRATARLTQLFLSVTGNDETLSSAEFAALVPADMPAEVVGLLFGMLDANNDGVIDLDEFLSVVGGGLSGIPTAPTIPPIPGRP
jgi:Ca2+-binding EF-hand superfamily protein